LIPAKSGKQRDEPCSSGQYDDFAAGPIFFHHAVCLDDFIQLEDFADLDVHGACRDLL
jgi:hypothetical protein